MQKSRKGLPFELQYELTAFLDLHEQHKLRKICRSMNNLLKARVGENIPKMRAFSDYLEFKFRRAMQPQFQRFRYSPPARFFVRHAPYPRIRAFRALERKAAELFGPNGERVENKSLTEPIYDDFLNVEFPRLNHKLFMVVARLSEDPPQNVEGIYSYANLVDRIRRYNFDAVFPQWMSQFRADWEALNTLCAELDKRRRWEQEMNHPTYPCDIHPEAPVLRIHHCAANRFHHLCEDCLRRVEEGETHHRNQCNICLF